MFLTPLDRTFTVDFFLNNWILVAIALVSGVLLVLPVLQGAAGAGISPAEAVQLMNRDKAVVVDVCSAQEFASGRVKGAVHVALDQLEARLADTVKDKTKPVIMVCASGMRSKRALAVAKKLGYQQVHSLQGGLQAWKDANLPIAKG
jgi:rhodanese-related sulfurtransferase